MDASAPNTQRRIGRLTTEMFVDRARSVHGDRYDYSGAAYTKAHAKVLIGCPVHGAFEQDPWNHMKGCGCPQCGVATAAATRTRDHDVFVSESRAVHGDRYDYSSAEYLHNKKPVEIICPAHGIFRQKPEVHKTGSGCPECGRERFRSAMQSNRDRFAEAARTVHGDRYDYSRVDYATAKKTVEIICFTHGAFWQTPEGHLAGRGCRDCGIAARGALRLLTTEHFIEKAKEVHGDRYDYGGTEYVRDNAKLEIVCKKHGPFRQTPNDHKQGRGCPSCLKSGGETAVAKWLDSHGVPHIDQWTDHGCRDRRVFKFDFYLPQAATLIEYDGQFHFKPIQFFGTSDTHEDAEARWRDTQRRDAIKNEWAAANGYRLIRIRYDQDVSAALDAALSDLIP